MDRIINLNIGGYKYCTTTATLTKYPNTFFTALLSEKLPTTKDEEGGYFIDRDGQFFSPILTWLRTDAISIPNSMTKEDVIREARFYSLIELVEQLIDVIDDSANGNPLECPPEIVKYVTEYFARQKNTILGILRRSNKEGSTTCSLEIIPGHRQDFERPPQLLESGKLGLYMNFTSLHISKYAHVQQQLALCFKEEGFSGYYRPGHMMELYWIDTISFY